MTFNHKHTSCEFVSDLSADLLLPGEEAFCCICINCECQKNKVITVEPSVKSTHKESLKVQSVSSCGPAWPPEARITVNGKTFPLKDIDKEMTK